MNHQHESSESGQVLVFLVLAMVGLLAFAALVVDGGLLLADHRGAQNAGDTAVLAGAYRIANSLDDYQMGYNIHYANWDCGNVQPVMDLGDLDARHQAGLNGYPITTTVNLSSTITITCEIGEDMGSYVDKYVDVTARINSQVETVFAQFATDGPLVQTIGSVSRVRPRMPLAFGYAIYAHRKSCPNSNTGGVHFSGSNQVSVTGGGVMSDACMDANGSAVKVKVTGGDINYITDYNPSGSPSISPSPTQQENLLPDWSLLFTEPDCSDLPNASSSGNGTINPGVYSGIKVTGSEALVMNPGLYCFTGDFMMNGKSVTGNGVTIYMISGDVTANGNADVNLSAPNYSASNNDGVTGVLIYLGQDNDGTVDLTGNSGSAFSGTIYGASEDSVIKISGTSDAVFYSQMIAGTVNVVGNANIQVDFNSNQVYSLPSRLTLEQ